MAILNLTPDSFWAPSRAAASDALSRIRSMAASGASIVDIGAVSTRPGAAEVSFDEELRRLTPVLRQIASDGPDGLRYSIDTTRSGIIRCAFDYIGKDLIVNDISAGEDDPMMLPLVGRLGLTYVAMHKRGNPRNMDSLCDYDVMPELISYFREFGRRAADNGVSDWILDPGLGFAKTEEQCWEILERLGELKIFGRPILVGASDKRFTRGDNESAHALAVRNGADILRLHI